MRLTRFGFHGLLFTLAMVGAFFASPYSNLFFLLLSFLCLLWTVEALASLRNLRRVALRLESSEPVASGTLPQLEATLSTGGKRGYQLDLRVELAGGLRLEGHEPLIEGRATTRLSGPPLERGIYALRSAELSSRYPFGWLRARRTVALNPPTELVVFPSPGTPIEGRSAREALEEILSRGSLDPGGDLQPAGLRDHREGEGLRGVHWRASARRGQLVVQEWEGGGGQGLEVVLDRRTDPESLEACLATVSSLVQLARSGKETLCLHTQDLSATFGSSERPWRELLRFLAQAQALPPQAPGPPPSSPRVLRLPEALAHG